jgi:hypothetical protein
MRDASTTASAAVIGIEAIRPIEPTSAAITSSATASPLTASVNEVPPTLKISNTGNAAPA